MPILFKKGGILKHHDGGILDYVYESADDLKSKRNLSGIQTRKQRIVKGPDGKETTSTITLCAGSSKYALGACGFDVRSALDKGYKNATRTSGDTDEAIDAWDALDAARASEDMAVIYDRERDGEITPEILANIPLHAWIGTGDARDVYVPKNNPSRVSRHAIVNLGFTKAGKPLIYDLGDVSEGIPEKYLKEINFIAAPKDTKYFKQPVREATAPTDAPTLPTPTSVTTSDTNINDIEPVPLLSDAKKYIAYLRSIHSKKQNNTKQNGYIT